MTRGNVKYFLAAWEGNLRSIDASFHIIQREWLRNHASLNVPVWIPTFRRAWRNAITPPSSRETSSLRKCEGIPVFRSKRNDEALMLLISNVMWWTPAMLHCWRDLFSLLDLFDRTSLREQHLFLIDSLEGIESEPLSSSRHIVNIAERRFTSNRCLYSFLRSLSYPSCFARSISVIGR